MIRNYERTHRRVGAGEYLPVMEEVSRYLLSSVNSKNTARRLSSHRGRAGRRRESVNRWSRMGSENTSKSSRGCASATHH
ncbi:MAG: hypothetical protein U0V48_08480 [Anaerolineales bacterium]